jgi:hypothetical protein
VGEMTEDGKFRVEQFNGKKYQLWKMHMEYYLYQKDLFLPLGGIENKSTTMNDGEWEVLERKTLGTIWLSLETSMAFNILKLYILTLYNIYYKQIFSKNKKIQCKIQTLHRYFSPRNPNRENQHILYSFICDTLFTIKYTYRSQRHPKP